VQAFAQAHTHLMRSFTARLAAATRQPEPRVEHDLAEGRFLDADEALAYGLVDEIWVRPAPVYRLYPRPLGFGPSR
jgi:ATP-dependent protease ClpP protease subunit